MDKFWQDAEQKWKDIQNMGLELMCKTDTIMPMLNGFVLEGNEVGQFPDLLAMFLYDGKQTADSADLQTYVNKAIEQIKSNRETNKDVYEIPMDVLEKKYHGCGNGIAVIDKTTRKVIDIDYTTARLKVITEQNISMCKSAGKIIKEDEKTITYRANFSSCQVCLF
jgi:hypothetical protein